MPAPVRSTAVEETREQRIQAILSPVRPIVEAKVRELVERAVDVSEAEEFGAIDLEFRDAGLDLANEVRQASVASQKKGVRRVQRDLRALRLRGQASLLPGASSADGSRGGAGQTGLLLLWPLPPEFSSGRRRPGIGR
jgi:hypothetical protein